MAWEEHCNIKSAEKNTTPSIIFTSYYPQIHTLMVMGVACKRGLGYSCTTQIIMWICREGLPSHALMWLTADAGGLMYQEVVYQKVWII